MSRRDKERRRSSGGYSDSSKRANEHGTGNSVFEMPEGFKPFKAKVNTTYDLRIFPYIVGKGNPWAKPGSKHYERSFFIHRNIGPQQQMVCCPARTDNQKCCVCAHLNELRAKSASDEEQRPFFTSERQLFLVRDMNDKVAGTMIYHESHHSFGKLLDQRIKSARPDSWWKKFFHLKGGSILRVTFNEESAGKGKYAKAVSIDFTKDKKSYSDSLLDKFPCLDDLLLVPTPAELKEKFQQGAEKDDEEPDDEDEDDTDDDEDDTDDDEDDEDEESDDEEDEDEDEEEDEPKKKSKKKKKSRRDEDEDDDFEDFLDEDEDDDDEPRKKKKKKRR